VATAPAATSASGAPDSPLARKPSRHLRHVWIDGAHIGLRRRRHRATHRGDGEVSRWPHVTQQPTGAALDIPPLVPRQGIFWQPGILEGLCE